MKKKTAAIILITAALLGGCREKGPEPNENEVRTQPTGIGAGALLSEERQRELPFSEYTFEFAGITENYMIMIRRGEFPDEISVIVENNRYESKEFIITAPFGYGFEFPRSSKKASSVVKVIKNDIDDSPVPDIMQFVFRISEKELERGTAETAHSVSRMYTIDERGELVPLKITTPADEENGIPETVSDTIDKTLLYHSEADKFIYEIKVDERHLYDEEGNFRPIEERVRIKTLTYDPASPGLKAGYENISTENPLYFGYAYWAAANSAARFFTLRSFGSEDRERFFEQEDEDGSREYYYKVKDPVVKKQSELTVFLGTVFDSRLVSRLLEDAPQQYKDINKELWGILKEEDHARIFGSGDISTESREKNGAGSLESTLGTLTFSGLEQGEDFMLFRSRQEKYDEDGNFTGYTDGGDFIISLTGEDIWKVTKYRYPYKG